MSDRKTSWELHYRWIWLAWLLLVGLPIAGGLSYVQQQVEKGEISLHRLTKTRLLDEMHMFVSQMRPRNDEFAGDEAFEGRVAGLLASPTVVYPDLVRQKALRPPGVSVPGFLENEAETAYLTFPPSEVVRFLMGSRSHLKRLSSGDSRPLIVLKVSAPAASYRHPLREWLLHLHLLGVTGILLSAFGIYLSQRGRTLAPTGLGFRTALVLGLGLLVPLTGFGLASASLVDYQSVFVKWRVIQKMNQQTRLMENYLTDFATCQNLLFKSLIDRLGRVQATNREEVVTSRLHNITRKGHIGRSTLLTQSGKLSIAVPESGKQRLAQDKAFINIENRLFQNLLPDLLRDQGTPIRSKQAISMEDFSEKLFVEIFIESAMDRDFLGFILNSDGRFFDSIDSMGFSKSTVMLLRESAGKPPWAALLASFGPKQLWSAFIHRISKPLSRFAHIFADEDGEARFEYTIFTYPMRHYLILNGSWPRESFEEKGELFQFALHALESRTGVITDLWDTSDPRLYLFRPYSDMPYICAAKAVPRASRSSARFLPGVLILGYSLFFLMFNVSLLSRMIFHPILLFSAMAERVKNGDFSTRLRIDSGDELQEISDSMNRMSEGLLEKKRLAKYVSATALEAVGSEEQFQARVERKFMTILFTHIRDFDRIVAEQSPESLLSFLNLYFSRMGQIIRRNGGEIDKFVGDAIMAVFPEKEPLRPSPERAATAALEMRQAVLDLNHWREEKSQWTVETGIGLNCGEVTAGRIGSKRGRQDFTVIGDPVNLAARLESQSHRAGTSHVVVSGKIAEVIGDRAELRDLGEIAIKGKAYPERIYELISLRIGDDETAT